jgi:hypothetical protein
MTDEPTPGSTASAPIPTTTCRVCGTEVPGGKFCGHCGSRLSRVRGDGPDWLRARAYGAADGENVLGLSVVSSLFPHLPHRSRTTFRFGLGALLVLLAVFALLQWQAPLIAVCALGLPLLFLVYIEESDVYGDDDLPERTLLLAAVIGAALGVGWAYFTAPVITAGYTTIGAASTQQILVNGLLIPVGGAVLMLVPAVIVRLSRPKNLESLDGFLIGALGAVAFAAAGTLVRLAPQIASGLVDRSLPVQVFIMEAGLQGIAVPLTAAAVGGLFGAALWFTWQGEPKPQQRRRLLEAALPACAIVVVLYAGIGLIDIAPIGPWVQLVLHLLIAAVAVLALRIGVHLSLLKETHEEMAGEPILCAECENVVPDMAFCPNCGVSTRAASRTSRTQRRVSAAGSGEEDASPAEAPGFALPERAYRVPKEPYTSSGRLFVILGACLAAVVAVIVVVSLVTTKPTPKLHCPEDCQQPPTRPPTGKVGPGPNAPTDVPNPPKGGSASGSAITPAGPADNKVQTLAAEPVESFQRWTRADYAWSVAHPEGAKLMQNGVSWSDFDGQVVLFSVPARSQSARDIAKQFADADMAGGQVVYELPNATLGYQAGYGEVDEVVRQTANGQFVKVRALFMVAVKDDLALAVEALGPYAEDSWGHPSGVGFNLAYTLGYYVNSFMWRGDPPR